MTFPQVHRILPYLDSTSLFDTLTLWMETLFVREFFWSQMVVAHYRFLLISSFPFLHRMFPFSLLSYSNDDSTQVVRVVVELTTIQEVLCILGCLEKTKKPRRKKGRQLELEFCEQNLGTLFLGYVDTKSDQSDIRTVLHNLLR